VGIDALYDDEFRFREDDHDLLIGPTARISNFGLYPMASAIVVTQVITGGWNFELSVPSTSIGLDVLSPGRIIGLTFGLLDDDNGSWRDAYMARLEEAAQITVP